MKEKYPLLSPQGEVIEKEKIEIDPRGIKLLRLTNRTLDLPTKKRIVQLIEGVGEEMISSVLNQKELDVLAIYSKNEKGEFRSQKIAARILYGTPNKFPHVVRTFRMAVRKIGWGLVNGENAIENLNLPDFLYISTIREGVRRIDQISTLPEEKIKKICGSPSGFEMFKEAVRTGGIDWEPPEVDFKRLPSGPGYSKTLEGRIYIAKLTGEKGRVNA